MGGAGLGGSPQRGLVSVRWVQRRLPAAGGDRTGGEGSWKAKPAAQDFAQRVRAALATALEWSTSDQGALCRGKR